MGGLFRAPKPVIKATPAVQAEERRAKQRADRSRCRGRQERGAAAGGGACPRARGLSGTIATGPRGVLDPLPAFAQRKTLLGE